MHRRPWRRGRSGAIVGLIALYAVLLQALLAGALPRPGADPFAILCADHRPGAPADGTPVHHDHACCTLAQAASVLPPPVAGTATPRPPSPPAIVPWRPEAEVPRTGPPTHAESARGPPLA